METPKSDFNFGLGTDMDLDFDTAYKNFEENFEEEIDEAVNYNNQQIAIPNVHFDKIGELPHQPFDLKTPEPANYNQHIEISHNLQADFKNQNIALTQNALSLLNADKTPSKIQDHLMSDNQSVLSGTFSEIIQKNAAYFQHQQVQPSLIIPKSISNTRPGTANPNPLFPTLDFQGFPNLKSPESQTPMSVSESPGIYPKSPDPAVLPPTKPSDEGNKKFNLLSVKETSELLNFLSKLEKPDHSPHKKIVNKQKLSYDDLLQKVNNIEKKLDAHKNKHKLSERKRRAVINERFNSLIELIKLPRKNKENEKKTRVTKYQQLQYVIEDIEEVTTKNAEIEVFLEKHGLMDQFELWKANLTK